MFGPIHTHNISRIDRISPFIGDHFPLIRTDGFGYRAGDDAPEDFTPRAHRVTLFESADQLVAGDGEWCVQGIFN